MLKSLSIRRVLTISKKLETTPTCRTEAGANTLNLTQTAYELFRAVLDGKHQPDCPVDLGFGKITEDLLADD